MGIYRNLFIAISPFYKFIKELNILMPFRSFVGHLKKITSSLFVRLYIKLFLRKIGLFRQRKIGKKIKIRSDIFDDFEKLSKPIEKLRNEYFLFNSHYGISVALKKYSGYTGPIHAAIEHGVYFGDFVNKLETKNNITSNIVTFGEYRRRILEEKTDYNIYPIGPYIHYAEPFLDGESYRQKKNILGKNLLVFPSHSIDNIAKTYNLKSFVDFLKMKSKEFNTTTVCLYWKDVLQKKHQAYKEAGFNIATAGHRNDPYFLSRLKSLIQLADMTVSNSLGTHIGYCIYLEKPHYIYTQKIEYESEKVGAIEKEFGNRGADYKEIMRRQEKEIFRNFSIFEDKISDKQKEICNKYWGIDQIKQSDELKQLLRSIRKRDLKRIFNL